MNPDEVTVGHRVTWRNAHWLVHWPAGNYQAELVLAGDPDTHAIAPAHELKRGWHPLDPRPPRAGHQVDEAETPPPNGGHR